MTYSKNKVNLKSKLVISYSGPQNLKSRNQYRIGVYSSAQGQTQAVRTQEDLANVNASNHSTFGGSYQD